MVKSGNQKIKLLRIIELLRKETDEMSPMTGDEMCERLAKNGISCDIKTLGRDIKYLNSQGYEVFDCPVGHKKGYYVVDRSFDVPELKILIDAVQAASFIPPKKTETLIDKIASLGGGYMSNLLQDNIVCYNTKKHSNESIYYNVGTLEEAIRLRKKASFFYFDIDENGKKIYRKDKERYQVSPLALIFSDDNYYLMTYYEKHDHIVNYRVDRMDHVDVEEEPLEDAALSKINNVTEYKEQMFLMFGGEKTHVELEFDNSLIGVVLDRFGESVRMNRLNNTTLTAMVNVQISPTFFGWVFQFGGKMRIVSPFSVITEYEKMKLGGSSSI